MTDLGPWGWAAAAAIVVFWMVGAYNRLVALRGVVAQAWAQVDDQLRRRAEATVPLLAACRQGPAALQAAAATLDAAERQLQAAVEALRPRPLKLPAAASLVTAEGVWQDAWTRLQAALAEAIADDLERYGSSGLDAAAELHGVSQQQQALRFARQAFDAAVLAYNAALRQFPTRLLGPLFGFRTGAVLTPPPR
ncbi:LemA family protein [Aquabacterium sp. J223]|uniref:LemA family protein n=1 Tax=Aquabacterium sp. J223 TaxID=2898431 RepID=UPI0021AD7F2F|nr:LemA family protein [Aquabacterium sp. J223]UUX95922.1 LemA family protein [Aquabacterium sp. J223]